MRLDAEPPEAPRQLPFGDAATLQIDARGDAAPGLFVVRDGERRDVACTLPDGAGAVHAIARTSFAQFVVGADAGLLVLDPQHPVADPLEVRDGLPRGAVLGVACDRRGRVWLCTREHFAVVDARFAYGRTFVPADGVPAPPYRGLSRQDGRIVLHTDRGAFAYRPDVGPAPRPAKGSIERAAKTASSDGVVRFAPEAAVARGAVQLRARRRHHHLIVPLEDGELRGLRPGSHVVDVFAVDRDLRRALVGRYDVRVPLPPQYSTRWLPPAAAVGVLLLAASAWPRRGRRRFWRAALCTGFGAALLLQLLAALLGYGRSWPFMGFSMYTETHHEGSALYKPEVRGRCENGRVVVLGDWFLDLRQDGYWQELSDVVHGGEARMEQLLATVRSRWPAANVQGFEFVDTRIRLTRDGPVDVAPVILRRWRWQ